MHLAAHLANTLTRIHFTSITLDSVKVDNCQSSNSWAVHCVFVISFSLPIFLPTARKRGASSKMPTTANMRRTQECGASWYPTTLFPNYYDAHGGSIVSLTPKFISSKNPAVDYSLKRSLPSARLQTIPSSSRKRPSVEQLAALIALGMVVDPNASGVDTL